MATYQALQEEVNAYLIDLPSAVVSYVPTYVKRAVKTLQNRHKFQVMEAETTFTTTVSTRDLGSKPSDWLAWRLEPYYLTDDTDEWNEIVLAPNRTAVRRYFENDDTGYPQMLLSDEWSTDDSPGTIEVWPLPDGLSDYDDGEYRIYVPYWKNLAELSAPTDTNWLTENGAEAIVFLATANGFFANWDPNAAAIWEQRAAGKIKEVINLDKYIRLGGTREMVPHWKGARKSFHKG